MADDVRIVPEPIIAALAETFVKGACLAVAQGTPHRVATEAMYRAALAMMIADVGQAQTIATLRDSADRLEAGDNSPRPLAN